MGTLSSVAQVTSFWQAEGRVQEAEQALKERLGTNTKPVFYIRLCYGHPFLPHRQPSNIKYLRNDENISIFQQYFCSLL